MANKPEKKRRRRVRTYIKDCKKMLNDFDQKGIKPSQEVKEKLMGKILDEIDFIEDHLIKHKLSLKRELSEQEKIDLLNIIKERENDLKDLRECLSGLLRIH